MTSHRHGERFLRATETVASLEKLSVTLVNSASEHGPEPNDLGAYAGEAPFLETQWAREVPWGGQDQDVRPALFHPKLESHDFEFSSSVMHADRTSDLTNWALETGYDGDADYEAYFDRLAEAGPILIAGIGVEISGISAYLHVPEEPGRLPAATGVGWAITLGGLLRERMPVASLIAAGFDVTEADNHVTARVTPHFKDVMLDTPHYLTRRKVFVSLFEKGFYGAR